MKGVEFFAHGIPIGQPRPRASRIGGFLRIYNPRTADAWKRAVKAGLRGDGVLVPDFGTSPVKVSIRFYFPHPEKHYRTGKNAYLLRAKSPTAMTAKPDLDNLLKSTLDALTEAGVWRDDSQVVRTLCEKVYHDKGGQSGALILIREIEDFFDTQTPSKQTSIP